ncbi:MAG: cytochrome c [Acidimicrobiia bacterium]|nr:cytochrome c [Acidimicrobiia bacterium]
MSRDVRFGLSALGIAFGVFSASAVAAEVPASPTYTRDVAPIFQEKCEACHRPDSIAPMSLRTYAEARPWARSIRARVDARQMPPWHIDKALGIQKFKNDRSLNDDQIETIVKWVDQGAPQGDPKDMPAARVWPTTQEWEYAKVLGQKEPDLIIRSTPWTQKAGANDTWHTPIVATGLTEPRWVRAVETRPGTIKGRKITHHANADILQIDPDAPAAAMTPGRFTEWAVGKGVELMRPDSGMLMLPGSRIGWDIHYSNGGEDITDVVELGIYFYPKGQEPKHRQHLVRMGKTGPGAIDIAPNSLQLTEFYFPLRQAARIESFQPHMHLRGKAQSLEAVLPTGQTVVLSHVAEFDFMWHSAYVYADDAAPLLPKGTIIKVKTWHDNTAAKRGNPDPNVWVGYGGRTVDEMAHAWVNVTYLSDQDYDAEVRARQDRLTRSTQQQQQ